MTDSLFQFSSKVLPAPSLTADPTPVIQLVDPVLYTLATFFAQLLNTNLQPRFSNEALHCGLTHAALDNFVDGYAVAQTTDFPLHNLTLKDNDFKFPMLNVVIENEYPHQLTLTNSAVVREFCVSWVLPPLTSRQYNRLYQFLGEATKIWTGYGQQGYDPKVNTDLVSVFKKCNASYGYLNSVSYEHFYGFDKAGQDADFPSIQFRLTLVEKQQLPVLANWTNSFNEVILTENLVDGYNPANPINHFIDGYIYPQLSLSSVSPNSGSINGNTILTLIGTGFLQEKFASPSQLTICGVPVKQLTVLSNTLIQAVTNIGINNTIGNVILTDNSGESATLTNSYTYIG